MQKNLYLYYIIVHKNWQIRCVSQTYPVYYVVGVFRYGHRHILWFKSRKNPSAELIFARDTLTNEIRLIRHELKCANEVVRDSYEKLRILRRELHMRSEHQRGREVKHRSYSHRFTPYPRSCHNLFLALLPYISLNFTLP